MTMNFHNDPRLRTIIESRSPYKRPRLAMRRDKRQLPDGNVIDNGEIVQARHTAPVIEYIRSLERHREGERQT